MAEEKYSKLIIKTVFKTLLVVFGFLSLVMSYIFLISPQTMGKAYNKLGMGNAELATYEQLYKKSCKNADLYNLIQKCLEKEDYIKAKKNIRELIEKEDFESFCIGVNKASIQKAGRDQVAYVVDLESYLYGQLLVCEYRLGNKSEAKVLALGDLSIEDNKYSFLLGVYYDEVLTDLSLTLAQAKNELMKTYNLANVKSQIDAKINKLDYTLETDEKLKIATLATKIKIMNYKRNLMNFVGQDIASINTEIASLQEIYEDLIK